nr:nuclear receptor 2DBD gamma [Hymenolepis microstoma]
MIDEVEGVRIPAYHSFETLSLARDQGEDDHIGQGHVMFFGEDLVDSSAIPPTERSKNNLHDSESLKVNGFISSDSSWVSTDPSEASTSAAVNSTKAPNTSQHAESASSAFFTEEMTPESAFTQYQRRSEDQACQVCGQPSVGFHHRAYVCEACKKFFTRHLTNRIKKDKASVCGDSLVIGDSLKSISMGGGNSDLYADLNVVCPMGGNCKIEGPGRGKCPHCRFRKCLDLGMSLTPPGGEIGCDVSKIPCRVCGGPSSGFHFGALTCEGCKGFFRRTVNSSSIPQCLGNQTCRITPSNRNMCKSCRFKKCLEVGMSQKRSRVGRQPNAIKYYCVREISQREHGNALPSPTDDLNESTNHQVGNQVNNAPRNVMKRGANNVSGSSSTFQLTGEFINNRDAVENRSRASTLSASSGISSSSTVFLNPLETSQSSPIVSSASLHKRLKIEDVPDFIAGTDMVDSSFCQQLASVTAANSFANHFLLNPQLTSHGQTPRPAEILNQLAKHPTLVAAAAAARILLDNAPSNGSLFDSTDHEQNVTLPTNSYVPSISPSSAASSFGGSRFQQPQHLQKSDTQSVPCTVPPPPPMPKLTDKVERQRVHDEAMRQGSEAALSMEEKIRTNVFVTLGEFTQGIERATDFLKSERRRLKQIKQDPNQPRFTASDSIERVWSYMMQQFVQHTRMVVDFSKLIAGFNGLGINDRRQLIRAAMYPIMLIELSRDFQNNENASYNYFDFMDHEKDVIIQHFPPLSKIIAHLVQSGRVLQQLKLDDIECTIICIQELLRHKNELEDPASCEHLFLLSMQALVYHEQCKSKSDAANERLTTFTQLLPMLNQLNMEHHEVLGQIRLSYPHLIFPELYLEMFAIGAGEPPNFFQEDSNKNRINL